MKIAPSVLSCDFSKMGDEIERITKAKADFIHLDVMDGHFVPNITFGAPVIKYIRKYSELPFDVHLMISHPFDYIDDFADAGADIITFHVESESDINKTLDKIAARGVKAGLVVKPNTPIETVFPYLDRLYMILIMTVEPGFGGQSFMHDMMPKAEKLKQEINRRGLNILIEADGGINASTIGICAKSGIDVSVSGTGVFKAADAAAAISELKQLSENALL